MNIRVAQAADLPKLIDLVSEAFQYKEKEKVSRDFPLLYSPANTSNLYVCEEGGELLAHAGFYTATMKLEGQRIPVAGIGGVCTDPKARGKGLASQLLETCLREAKARGAALAFLWTDKHDFYRKLGFELVGRQWSIELVDDALGRLREKMEARAESFRFSTEKGADFFSQSLGLLEAQVLGIARNLEEHSALLGSECCRAFSAWEGTKLKAYLVLGKGRDLTDYIHEWAGEEAALLWLLSEATKEGGSRHLLSPQFMPGEESWLYILEALGFPMSAQYMGMVKILDLKPVLAVLSQYLQGLGLAPSELSIGEKGGTYEVVWRKTWTRTLTEGEFLRFLFGPEPPDQQELGGALPLRLWYWGMDSI